MQVGQSRFTTTTTTITITIPSGRGSSGSTTKYHGEGESDETRLFTHRVVAFGRAGDRNRYNPMGEAEDAGARGLARTGEVVALRGRGSPDDQPHDQQKSADPHRFTSRQVAGHLRTCPKPICRCLVAPPDCPARATKRPARLPVVPAAAHRPPHRP